MGRERFDYNFKQSWMPPESFLREDSQFSRKFVNNLMSFKNIFTDLRSVFRIKEYFLLNDIKFWYKYLVYLIFFFNFNFFKKTGWGREQMSGMFCLAGAHVYISGQNL